MKKSQSNSLNTQLQESLPGSIHYNFAFSWDQPTPHFVEGRGHNLTDVDGEVYVDFFSKFGAAILGHGNKKYIDSVATAMQKNLTAVDHFGPNEVAIIERLLRAVPGAEQVRFSLSGTEAVVNAMRIARAYTNRQRVIRFTGHYHGSSDSLLGGGMQGGDHPYELVPVEGDPRGTAGRAQDSFRDMLLLPWNDQEALASALDQYKGEVAAIIMEPICINGGGISASKEYCEYLRAAATKHGVLLIFDEVITGFRLGYGSAQNIVGIQPDMWIFGKAIAGGSFPVSCVMASKDIMRVLTDKKATHGGTFNGYNIGLHAVDATLNILEDDSIYQKAIIQSDRLRAAIHKAAAAHNVELVIQGHAMAMCLHACSNTITSGTEWTDEIKAKEAVIRNAFKSQHILLAPPCRLYPSIALDETMVTHCILQLDSVFTKVREAYDVAGYEK
jgi:glutamate-1-semialdehyde 2,1-aminomutase